MRGSWGSVSSRWAVSMPIMPRPASDDRAGLPVTACRLSPRTVATSARLRYRPAMSYDIRLATAGRPRAVRRDRQPLHREHHHQLPRPAPERGRLGSYLAGPPRALPLPGGHGGRPCQGHRLGLTLEAARRLRLDGGGQRLRAQRPRRAGHRPGPLQPHAGDHGRAGLPRHRGRHRAAQRGQRGAPPVARLRAGRHAQAPRLQERPVARRELLAAPPRQCRRQRAAGAQTGQRSRG